MTADEHEKVIEELAEDVLRLKLSRGDFHDPSEIALAKRLIRAFDKQKEFEARCEIASKSEALNAKRSATLANIIALLALAAALKEQIYDLLTALL